MAFKHEIGDLSGALGLHGLFDELKIDGEKTIFSGGVDEENANTLYNKITNEDSKKLAVFLVEEYALSDKTTLNGGIRWEHYDRENRYQWSDIDLDDSTVSGSVGFTYNLNEIWNLSSNLNYTERLPDTAELYS